jgi:stage IV sporulation protein B
MPDLKLIPSGEAIGVKIEAKGVLVVGMSSVNSENGKKYSPAADVGIEIGDAILEIDGNKVEKERDIIQYLNTRKDKQKTAKVLIKRAENEIKLEVEPVLCQEDGMYKIGLWVRDSIAGVGTMTFYDPKSKAFGALGHGITDIDSGVLVDISKGNILKSTVASVQKARKTMPGEIVGLFYDGDDPYGNIDKNTQYGIYGKLNKYKQDTKIKPLSVGLSHQIKEGPAKILTTIEDNKIEEYDIEIQKINRQSNANSKSMLIKITDPRLLEKTGGIVQGMSGSPIIQDGRLIGAVTHVLINDPSKGYGIFIEWMLKEADIDLGTSYKAVAGQ